MLRNVLLIVAVLSLVFGLVGCSYSPTKEVALEAKTVHRIIIDSDTAGDDALAIAMAARSPNIILEGVTVLAGNVELEQGARNALMTLEMAGRPDVPVFKGSDTTLSGVKVKCYSVYGKDGMGDMDLIHPEGEAQKKSAQDFILETVRKYPDEIEILSIGPATNIAKAIIEDPETMSRVKRIWSMGSAGMGSGNATPVAEFNVYNDASAYKVVTDSDIPLTVIGLDMCHLDEILYYEDDIAMLEQSSELGSYLAKSWNMLYKFNLEERGWPVADICDGTAAGVLIWDNFAKESINCAAYVCTEETPTYGQVVFYREGYTYEEVKIKIKSYTRKVISALEKNSYKAAVKKLISE